MLVPAARLFVTGFLSQGIVRLVFQVTKVFYQGAKMMLRPSDHVDGVGVEDSPCDSVSASEESYSMNVRFLFRFVID